MEEQTIICPHCEKEIPLSDAVLHRFKEQFKKQSDEELERKKLELEKTFEKEKEIVKKTQEASNQAIRNLKEQLEQKDDQLKKEREEIEKEAIKKAAEASESAIKNLKEQLKAKDSQLEKEREKLEEEITKKAREELNTEMEDMKEQVEEQKKKLDESQKLELQIRKEKRELEDSKKNLELEMTRKLDAEREKIKEATAKSLSEAYRLKDLEKEKQIGDMRKQIEDLKRKAEQGSQQTQGEVLELELEEILTNRFRVDNVVPVPKGIPGADVIQTVHDKGGLECGKIIWESKRAKAWGGDWISKLKDDQRAVKAEIAVLVTTALPKEVKNFGLINGVWVSDYASFEGLAIALRTNLIQLAVVKRSSVGKNEKIEALYTYINGPEFTQKIEAIVEAFNGMKQELEQEKRVFTKVWARREKQINRVVDNTIGLYGDVQSLSGSKLPQIKNLELKSLESAYEEEDLQNNTEEAINYETLSLKENPQQTTFSKDDPIEILGLSTNLENHLKNADIKTIGKLHDTTSIELYKIRGVGGAGLTLLEEAKKKIVFSS